MQDPEDFNESILKFMGAFPVFEFGQKERYKYLHEIGTKLPPLRNAFDSYRNAFSKLETCIDQITNSMLSISGFAITLKNSDFSQIMGGLKKSVSEYINKFDSSVISPLDTFIHQFEEMDIMQQVYSDKKSLYDDAWEKYMSDGNPPTKQLPYKIQNLMDTHKYKTTTFVNLYNKMENISNMIKNLTTAILIGFTDSLDCQNKAISDIIVNHSSILSVEEKKNIKNLFDPKCDDEAASILYNTVNSVEPYYWTRITVPFPGTSKNSIQGILYKKGSTFGKWKKSFVMVSGGNLLYSRTLDGYMKNQKVINLLLCSVKPTNDEQRLNCFVIINKDRQFVFQTSSQYDCKLWTAVIENNIIMSMNSGHVSSIAHHKCADCGAVDASWITLNWGQYICSRCSGIHRSLGPSYSRVRSPTLDVIPKYQRETFDKIREITDSNEILEKNVGSRKITASASGEERSIFIQDKYVTLSYAARTKLEIMSKIKNNDFNSVYSCVCAGLHRTFKGFLPIHEAAIVGNPHILCLIALHSDLIDIPDENGWTPLTYAVFYGNKEAVLVLKELGASENASSTVPLWKAALSGGNKEMCAMFPNKSEKMDEMIIPPHGPLAKRFVTELDIIEDDEIGKNRDNQGLRNSTRPLKKRSQTVILHGRYK